MAVQRRLTSVPRLLRLGVPLMLLSQLWLHGLLGERPSRFTPLPPPGPVQRERLMSLNDPLAAARVLNLWLQAYDTQPGVSVPLSRLDYGMVIRWLERILQLDPQTQYPLLVAAHIYGSVSDGAKKRRMMDYIATKFDESPQRYWRWMAHAVVVARHELHDLPLALRYARALSAAAKRLNRQRQVIPYWASDMQIIVLEDMGELEAARVLLGALLDQGTITDPYEIRFLSGRLQVLQQKLMNNRQDVENSTESR